MDDNPGYVVPALAGLGRRKAGLQAWSVWSRLRFFQKQALPMLPLPSFAAVLERTLGDPYADFLYFLFLPALRGKA